MKKFLLKIVVFFLPIIIVFLIPVAILFVTGENYQSIDGLIKGEQNYLIGYAYNEGNYKYLKQKELENRQSLSVLALGSSRVLQFRDKMFTKPFYNAGYTVVRISEFTQFVKSNLINKKPKVLLVGLDQWMFNKNWDDLKNYGKKNIDWKSSYNYNASISTIFKIFSDLASKKYGLETILPNYEQSNQKKIGLQAFLKNTGFRKDGSFFYGNQISKLLSCDSTAEDFEYVDTYSRIENGNRCFEYGDKVSEISLQALNDFLSLCKSNNIYVVAILPPFANSVNYKMKQSGNYSYMDSIYYKAINMFEYYHFELWDMSNLNNYYSSDDETIDGFHGSEVTYTRILINMIKNGSKLKDFTNLEVLQNDLLNRENNYSVYPSLFFVQ
jgi:hypothetical protein